MIKNLLLAVVIAMLGFTGWYVYHSRSITNRLLDDSANLQQYIKPQTKKTTSLPFTNASTATETNNASTPIPTVSQTTSTSLHNSCLGGQPKPGRMMPYICAVLDR